MGVRQGLCGMEKPVVVVLVSLNVCVTTEVTPTLRTEIRKPVLPASKIQ